MQKLRCMRSSLIMKVESGYMRLTSRDIEQLIQCGLLCEGETTEGVVLMQQLIFVD